MNLTVALEVAAKRRTADDVECTGKELGQLILLLLKLFDYAASKLYTELGRVAVLSTLHTFAECAGDDDFSTECASRMIIAHYMMADAGASELRQQGAHEMERQVNRANEADQIDAVIDALVSIWRTLLPASDIDLLTHFVHELEGAA